MASRDVEHSAATEGHEATPRLLCAAFAVPPAAERADFPNLPFLPPSPPSIPNR